MTSSNAISIGEGVGIDLTPYLVAGSQFSFSLSQDIISNHPVVAGSAAPYGLAIVFAIARAGHLELMEVDALNPQSIPVGCFADGGAPLGPDNYTIAFTRVYAYTQLTNANPAISGIFVAGAPIDLVAGATVPRCNQVGGCNLDVDVVVSPSSQETYISGNSGATTREQIWVDYYTSLSQFNTDSLLLYDPVAGAILGTTVQFDVPASPGEGTVWVVVRDNRGGVDWVQFPIYVQ